MLNFLIRILKFSIKAAIVVAGIAIVISYARLSEFGDMRKELVDKSEGIRAIHWPEIDHR